MNIGDFKGLHEIMGFRINLPNEAIAAFCRKWRITRLEVFGSALREDFHPESDIDFLVSFDPESRWSLFNLVTMEMELTEIVGRKVDLVTRDGVERSRNWIRKQAIPDSAELFYAA
jgi:uncharacterized protein